MPSVLYLLDSCVRRFFFMSFPSLSLSPSFFLNLILIFVRMRSSFHFAGFRFTFSFAFHFQNEITIGYCELLVLSEWRKMRRKKNELQPSNEIKMQTERSTNVKAKKKIRKTLKQPCTTHNRQREKKERIIFMKSKWNTLTRYVFTVNFRTHSKPSFAFYVEAKKFMCSVHLLLLLLSYADCKLNTHLICDVSLITNAIFARRYGKKKCCDCVLGSTHSMPVSMAEPHKIGQTQQ